MEEFLGAFRPIAEKICLETQLSYEASNARRRFRLGEKGE